MTDPSQASQRPSEARPVRPGFLLERDGALSTELLAGLPGAVPWGGYPGSLSMGEVSKVINPGEGLMRWANRIGLQGVTMDDHRAATQSRGNVAHAVLEQRGGEAPERGTPGYGVWLWWATEKPRLLACEVRVATSGLAPDVHGKLDAAYAVVDPDGRPATDGDCYAVVVVDFKPMGRTFLEQHIQVSGYAWALSEQGVHVARPELVLYDDRSYQVVPSVVTIEMARSYARMAARTKALKSAL